MGSNPQGAYGADFTGTPPYAAPYGDHAVKHPNPGATQTWHPSKLGSTNTPIDDDVTSFSFMFSKAEHRDYMQQYISQKMADPKTPPHEKRACEFALARVVSAAGSEEETEWFWDFITWMAGRPRNKHDVPRTPWLKEVIVDGTREWDERIDNFFKRSPELGALIEMLQKMRTRFLEQKEILKFEGPLGKMAGGDLKQCFLYYKYVVRSDRNTDWMRDADMFWPTPTAAPAEAAFIPSAPVFIPSAPAAVTRVPELVPEINRDMEPPIQAPLGSISTFDVGADRRKLADMIEFVQQRVHRYASRGEQVSDAEVRETVNAVASVHHVIADMHVAIEAFGHAADQLILAINRGDEEAVAAWLAEVDWVATNAIVFYDREAGSTGQRLSEDQMDMLSRGIRLEKRLEKRARSSQAPTNASAAGFSTVEAGLAEARATVARMTERLAERVARGNAELLSQGPLVTPGAMPSLPVAPVAPLSTVTAGLEEASRTVLAHSEASVPAAAVDLAVQPAEEQEKETQQAKRGSETDRDAMADSAGVEPSAKKMREEAASALAEPAKPQPQPIKDAEMKPERLPEGEPFKFVPPAAKPAEEITKQVPKRVRDGEEAEVFESEKGPKRVREPIETAKAQPLQNKPIARPPHLPPGTAFKFEVSQASPEAPEASPWSKARRRLYLDLQHVANMSPQDADQQAVRSIASDAEHLIRILDEEGSIEAAASFRNALKKLPLYRAPVQVPEANVVPAAQPNPAASASSAVARPNLDSWPDDFKRIYITMAEYSVKDSDDYNKLDLVNIAIEGSHARDIAAEEGQREMSAFLARALDAFVHQHKRVLS